MTEWNDDRLDEFRERVDGIDRKLDEGFGMMRQEFTRIDQKMDSRFDLVHERLDGLQRTLMQTGGLVIAALIGVIATQI